MMKLTCIFFGLLISLTAASQNVEELDKKAGFKEFRIGDSVSVYGDKVKPTRTLDNADMKLYLAKDLVSVKSYTGEVELVVYKGKVQEVIVAFKNSSEGDFEDLVKSLQTLYGEYTKDKAKDKDKSTARFEKIYTWMGQKIKLRAGHDKNYKLTKLVYSENESLDKLKDEF
jgi:arginine utilization protein RocB